MGLVPVEQGLGELRELEEPVVLLQPLDGTTVATRDSRLPRLLARSVLNRLTIPS